MVEQKELKEDGAALLTPTGEARGLGAEPVQSSRVGKGKACPQQALDQHQVKSFAGSRLLWGCGGWRGGQFCPGLHLTDEENE